ncbi:hypothetical protein BJ166DRAFT_279683 [Pestalotiopsis sp. NC0098]|nr:hypothetical protein BJ166DRAFT_279683 [Pestalotiopsis sp. NC0098]
MEKIVADLRGVRQDDMAPRTMPRIPESQNPQRFHGEGNGGGLTYSLTSLLGSPLAMAWALILIRIDTRFTQGNAMEGFHGQDSSFDDPVSLASREEEQDLGGREWAGVTKQEQLRSVQTLVFSHVAVPSCWASSSDSRFFNTGILHHLSQLLSIKVPHVVCSLQRQRIRTPSN